MVLKEGLNGHTYRVLSIQIRAPIGASAGSTRSDDGSLITILNNDKHGALTVKFRGTRFALGRRIADHIEIEEVHTHE